MIKSIYTFVFIILSLSLSKFLTFTNKVIPVLFIEMVAKHLDMWTMCWMAWNCCWHPRRRRLSCSSLNWSNFKKNHDISWYGFFLFLLPRGRPLFLGRACAITDTGFSPTWTWIEWKVSVDISRDAWLSSRFMFWFLLYTDMWRKTTGRHAAWSWSADSQ